jgi:N-acetylglucosaminyldiphosphoundecaprenol N-acetyl-beta-D-mannosaminyltransferase
MLANKILNITVPTETKNGILEKIKKYIINRQGFCQIISLNPEIIVIAQKDLVFRKIIEKSQIKIIDGQGVILAARILGLPVGERYPGVDLMTDLIKEADKMRLRVLFIGGKPNLAIKLANCYQSKMLQAKFFGLEGIKNIKKPTKTEEKQIFSIVADYKPHLVFVAFGSPDQEKWIERHADQFKNCIVMGVGGAFDYLSGKIGRAPVFFRKLGLEWLYRLVRQPWRLFRQWRLIKFCFLVFKQKIGKLNS